MSEQNYGGLLRMDTAYATGFIVETALYSVYACLFIAALPGMTSPRRLRDSRTKKSGWVFLVFTILMFIIATLHLILAGFRFYKTFFLNVDPQGAVSYLKSFNHFEYMWLICLFCLQTWLGDILVIYRCYFVWDSNPWVIFLPVCLLLASIAVNLPIWYSIERPGRISPQLGTALFGCIYPIAFAQNFITTSLIILKIVLQHRASKGAGVVHVGSRYSLTRVIRIIIESAALYTTQLLLLIILYFRLDNAQFVVQAAINPSIGITFVLLAFRIQGTNGSAETAETDLGVSSTMIPAWLRDNDSASNLGSMTEKDPNTSFLVGEGNELGKV